MNAPERARNRRVFYGRSDSGGKAGGREGGANKGGRPVPRAAMLEQAEADAQKKYEAEMTVKRAEAAQYAAERLKDTDGAVNEIVRRVKRGGC